MMAGVFEGDDGIEAFFHSHPNSDDDENRKGFLHIHTLTTPIVEVAGDGESAMYPGDQPTPPTPYQTLPDDIDI